MPEEYKAPNGIENADVIVFVTARPVSSGVLAWASACQATQTLGRPIAG